MKFSIITPSLNRSSLKQCCESVDSQSYSHWEHLIAYDGEPRRPFPVDPLRSDARRKFFVFAKTRMWGNYQRHHACWYVTGDVTIFLDEDNKMANPDALKDIAERIQSAPNFAWYLFPIHRHGAVFLMDPPGMCRTDSANMVIRREFAQWPNTEAREADGMLAERLKTEHPYVAFPDCPPIITMEHSSDGQ